MVVETEQRERLEREAGARGVSVATLVREAIDLAFLAEVEVRHRAAEEILAATAPRRRHLSGLASVSSSRDLRSARPDICERRS